MTYVFFFLVTLDTTDRSVIILNYFINRQAIDNSKYFKSIMPGFQMRTTKH